MVWIISLPFRIIIIEHDINWNGSWSSLFEEGESFSVKGERYEDMKEMCQLKEVVVDGHPLSQGFKVSEYCPENPKKYLEK